MRMDPANRERTALSMRLIPPGISSTSANCGLLSQPCAMTSRSGEIASGFKVNGPSRWTGPKTLLKWNLGNHKRVTVTGLIAQQGALRFFRWSKPGAVAPGFVLSGIRN